MVCKGICIRYKCRPRFDKPDNKKCKKCNQFIKWVGRRCPCCGMLLSRNPNNSKNRTRLKEQRGVIEIA